MEHRNRILRALAAAAACSVVMTAAAHPQDGVVKVGVLTDMGGTFADVAGQGSVTAAQMAIEDFGGKVLGKPIGLISADHQAKPDVAIAVARQWYDTEGVDVIVDLPNSPAALAVQNLAKDKKKITMISGGSTEALTMDQCSPYGANWTFNSYSNGKVLASALATPDSTWYFLTVDNIGGHSLEESLTRFLEEAGAKVVGSSRHPLNTSDMASYLLMAQASGAEHIVFANSGTDLVNVMKQAREFGLTGGAQQLATMVMFISDLKGVGLDTAAGIIFPTSFSPESSPEAGEWAKRFLERRKAAPSDVQAGVYSSVLHYLKAVEAAGTDDADAVMAKMRELPVNDTFAKNGVLREDGRMVHDMYLVQAKTPDESEGPWDLVKLVKTIPGDEAFRPLSESTCPLVKAQ
ncbi:MAG: ABC transporter substrate-binding protein [Amaricoccus sp.]|uniref:ABC transporter substrate-binding protein n=1 Tax=Amaricoccus sp. TaxID=1872485 RepID=UPI0039E411DE